jgi:aminoglycoside phosphotransferase (APT) family kinase protein
VTRPEDVAAWLRDRVGRDVTVGELTSPSSGFSNDTLITTADWGEGPREIVLRLAPEGRGLFPRYDLSAQAAVLLALRAHSDVPVPDVLWNEPDPAPLGRPFFVMSRVPGRIPPDGHIFGGWVKDLSATDQTRVLDGVLDVLARIHRVDVGAAGLDAVLDRSEFGASLIDQELGYWRAHLDWSSDGDRLETCEAVYSWCAEHRPSESGFAPSLVWGDARLGNLVIGDELRPAAVLDWEMAVVGAPELDLGWVLFLDRTALQYGEQLPGFLDRAGLVAEYQRRLGRPVHDLHWYEAWGGFRAACVQVRLAETPEARDRNPVTKALRSMLDLSSL